MQSLSRALTVLDILGRKAGPLTLGDIASEVGLHKSTVHRMLATFVDYGLVRRDEANRYVVGLGAIDLARAARGESVSGEIARNPLAVLSEVTGQAAACALPRGAAMVCINVTDLRAPLQPALGSAVPMHSCVTGVAYLAHRPRYEIDRYAERVAAGSSGVEPFGLRRALAGARRAGYALDYTASAADATAVAVPVFGADGFAVGAVISGLPSGFYGPDLRRFVSAAKACAERIAMGLVEGIGQVAVPRERPLHTEKRGA